MTPSLNLNLSLDGAVTAVTSAVQTGVYAVTNDGVDPRAREFCRDLGKRTPMSTEILKTIEATIRKQIRQSPIKMFTKATIGYARGGCVQSLAESDAGLRFLTLAAIFVTSMDNNTDDSVDNSMSAPDTLYEMLKDINKGREVDFLPTPFVLKDLLDVLKPQLVQADFLREVLRYKSKLPVSHIGDYSRIASYPSPIEIAKLAAVLRDYDLTCEEEGQSATALRITASNSTAWIAGFVCWSLGQSPIIEDEDRVVYEKNEKSRVSLCFSNDSLYDNTMQIQILRQSKDSSIILEAVRQDEEAFRSVTGMVDLKEFGQLTLLNIEANDPKSPRHRFLMQMLPYALHLVWLSHGRMHSSTYFNYQNLSAPILARLQPLNALPGENVIAWTAFQYLCCSKAPVLRSLPPGKTIAEMTFFKDWAETEDRKTVEHWARLFAPVIADITALSLFFKSDEHDDGPETVRLLHSETRLRSDRIVGATDWRGQVENIIQSSSNGYRFVMLHHASALSWAMVLVGHKCQQDLQSYKYVASSDRGQVVIPRLLLKLRIEPDGYACLALYPGSLMFENEGNRTFTKILSRAEEMLQRRAYERQTRFDVDLNLYIQPNDRKPVVLLGRRADHLELTVGWNRVLQRPFAALVHMYTAVYVRGCDHPTLTPLVKEHTIAIMPPDGNQSRDDNSRGEPRDPTIYPLYGNEELKVMALAAMTQWCISMGLEQPHVLINDGACANCLLEIHDLLKPHSILL